MTSSHRPLVVVTGGAGFIGSHTVDLLVERGHRVVVLDDFSTGKRANLAQWAGDPAVQVAVVDISHGLFAPLAPITAQHGPVERIVHLAAQVSVVHSMANPLADLRVNYGGTVEVLEYARVHRVKKVVMASSAAIYGDVAALPVVEEAPGRPLSPYGVHKLASELMMGCYSASHGVPTTPLRFFNVYGPRQDPSSPYSGVISIFADRARDGRDLTIFGDGEQTRDFVYVGDVVRAIVGAVTSDAGDGSAINIGTGREITINQLAATIAELAGGKSRIAHAPPRSGEILRSVARVDRARELLGWQAEVALRDGLARTLA